MVAANFPDLTTETPLEVADVIKRFKICRRTFENWCADGLEAFKLRGRVYTTLEAISRFAEPVTYDRRSASPVVSQSRADAAYDEARRALRK